MQAPRACVNLAHGEYPHAGLLHQPGFVAIHAAHTEYHHLFGAERRAVATNAGQFRAP